MSGLKSRAGSVLLGAALVAMTLGGGVAWSHPGKHREPEARSVLDSGYQDSAVVRADGSVWVWGEPYSYIQDPAPAPMAGLTDVTAISTSGMHTLALREDGTVWAWGRNFSGQLGDGTFDERLTAAPVADLTEVVAISAGGSHSLALREDGTVWAWGGNFSGQLGLGAPLPGEDYRFKLRPVRVGSLTDVVAISAGEFNSLALRADGTVWAWGDNFSGQLGNGTVYGESFSPVQVPGLTEVKHIDAGRSFLLALRADGTVWAWGSNFSGQLGDGTRTDRSSPVQVAGLPKVVAVAGGAHHALALTKHGVVWTWGGNRQGELGDGTRTDRLSPAPVPELEKVVAIAAGHFHSLAKRKDGTVWGWGYNLVGQVGDGLKSEPRLTPTRALLPCRSTGLPSQDGRDLASRECHGAH